MKYIMAFIVFIVLFLLASLKYSLAQENCAANGVIPASPLIQNNPSCAYTPFALQSDASAACITIFYSMKNDYQTRCETYWNARNQPTQQPPIIIEVQVTPTASPVTPTSIVYPTQIYYPIETPTPTSTATPTPIHSNEIKTPKAMHNKLAIKDFKFLGLIALIPNVIDSIMHLFKR